ncbi:acyltransferase [Tamlana sp. s12]|uniref:acyltransferase n=1 Tax=Tamlana sp. s12 TaxID=1630406 RepID=UPI000801AD6C|nr:acyltransferase [Tamlana sp. s12]OBQ55583.1 hypothetical protein VQ01_09095 [Tamlana sp. s12]QQY83739.1 acyltransferase [Tamlana sp. s12]
MYNFIRSFIRNVISSLVLIKGKLQNPRLEVGKNSRIQWNVKFKGSNPISFGNNVSIRDGAIFIPLNGYIKFGNNCSVGAYNVIDGSGGLEVGNNVRIGPHVCIYSANHKFESKVQPIYKQGLKFEQVVIKDNVWIGANVTILAGITIESGSVIAAGSLVNKDIETDSIVAGVPAKLIKKR